MPVERFDAATLLAAHDDTEERKALHLKVCAPSAASLRLLCQRNSVSTTALIDALAHAAGAADETSPFMAGVLEAARRIEESRRARF